MPVVRTTSVVSKLHGENDEDIAFALVPCTEWIWFIIDRGNATTPPGSTSTFKNSLKPYASPRCSAAIGV